MLDWLSENWIALLVIVAYLVERIPTIPAKWKRIAAAIVAEIEDAHRTEVDPVKAEAIKGLKRRVSRSVNGSDARPLSDIIAEAGDDKHRRSRVQRVLSGVMRLLPFHGRLGLLAKLLRK